MIARNTDPELVAMIRRLFDELLDHDQDYHHRTDRRLLMDVGEFLVAAGELPAPEPLPSPPVRTTAIPSPRQRSRHRSFSPVAACSWS